MREGKLEAGRVPAGAAPTWAGGGHVLRRVGERSAPRTEPLTPSDCSLPLPCSALSWGRWVPPLPF